MSRPGAPAHATIASIECLRAVACLLVVYCHIIAGRSIAYGEGWSPVAFVQNYVTGPLGIIQEFGFFGVALFFLISGFIITHSVQRESRATFVVRRVFRIFPTLWFALAVALLVHYSDWWITGTPNSTQQLAAWENFASLTALNPLFGANGPVMIVWTLSIELFFYFYAVLLLPQMRSRPGVACGVLIALSLIATTMFARLGLLVFGVMHEWLPVFGIGMAVYYGWSGRLKPGAVTVLCLIAWCALVYNLQITQPFFLAYPTSYTTQIGYVIAVFLGGLWAMAAIRESARPVRFFSDISYSLYLMHYPIGVLTMDRLYPVLGFTASAVVSLALCFGASAVSLRLIERPAQNFGRALTRSPLFERPIPVPAKV